MISAQHIMDVRQALSEGRMGDTNGPRRHKETSSICSRACEAAAGRCLFCLMCHCSWCVEGRESRWLCCASESSCPCFQKVLDHYREKCRFATSCRVDTHAVHTVSHVSSSAKCVVSVVAHQVTAAARCPPRTVTDARNVTCLAERHTTGRSALHNTTQHRQ